MKALLNPEADTNEKAQGSKASETARDSKREVTNKTRQTVDYFKQVLRDEAQTQIGQTRKKPENEIVKTAINKTITHFNITEKTLRRYLTDLELTETPLQYGGQFVRQFYKSKGL